MPLSHWIPAFVLLIRLYWSPLRLERNKDEVERRSFTHGSIVGGVGGRGEGEGMGEVKRE